MQQCSAQNLKGTVPHMGFYASEDAHGRWRLQPVVDQMLRCLHFTRLSVNPPLMLRSHHGQAKQRRRGLGETEMRKWKLPQMVKG